MGANGLDEYWVPEHVKDYLRRMGFVLPLDDMEPRSGPGMTGCQPAGTSTTIGTRTAWGASTGRTRHGDNAFLTTALLSSFSNLLAN